MSKNNLFLRKKFLKYILVFFLNILSFNLVFRNIFAQSLLSEPDWLNKNIYLSKNIQNYSNNTALPPSDLFFTPENFYETKSQQLVESISKSLVLNQTGNKSLFSKNINENTYGALSESKLQRFFPWFSITDVSQLDNLDEYHSKLNLVELADKEFSGIIVWFPKIQNLLKRNPEKARKIFLDVEEKLDIEDRTLLKLQIHYFLNEWYKAEILAKAFLEERPKSKNIPIIFYYLNKSLLAQKKKLIQNIYLREITIKFLNPSLRSDFLQILSNEAYINGNTLVAVKYRLQELRNSETSKFSNEEILLRLLSEIRSLSELQILLESFPNLIWLKEKVLSIQMNILIENRRYHEALGILEKRENLAKEIGDKDQVLYLNDIRANLSKYIKVNPRKIGVILPISSTNSKIARLAQETLDGLWIALHAKEFLIKNSGNIGNKKNQKNLNSKVLKNSNFVKDYRNRLVPWELVIRDSQLNEEVTKSVVHDLVEKENVIAIIGPLARKTSEAASEVAEMLGVPLISLSLTDSIPKLGDYIFRNNKKWKQEVTELLDYAVSELRACRFVILFSENREGRQKMRYFFDEALKKKCEIVAIEGFKDEGQKSLVNEFDTFTGKNIFINKEDKNILKELKEKEDPIHNFDAVFVAVGYNGAKNLRLIFPYSSVYKMEKITFLGDSGWNDLAIQFAPGLRGVKNPIFVDSFFSGSETSAIKMLLSFHERILYKHQNYIGPTDYTAYAYDTLMMLLKLLYDQPNQNHYQLKESLLNINNFSGVTGKLSFNEDGEIQRELQLLTLKKGKIEPLFKNVIE